MDKRTWGALGLCVVTLLACSKKNEATGADAAPPSASASASAAPSGSAFVPGEDLTKVGSNDDPKFRQLGLGDRLVFEQTHRPKITPNADSLFAEFEKLGAKYTSKKQVAGWTIGARYCYMSDTAKDVSIVVCEFDDEKSATAGAERSAKADKILKFREVIRKKNVFVAVNDLSEGKEGAAEAKAIKDYVNKL